MVLCCPIGGEGGGGGYQGGRVRGGMEKTMMKNLGGIEYG